MKIDIFNKASGVPTVGAAEKINYVKLRNGHLEESVHDKVLKKGQRTLLRVIQDPASTDYNPVGVCISRIPLPGQDASQVVSVEDKFDNLISWCHRGAKALGLTYNETTKKGFNSLWPREIVVFAGIEKRDGVITPVLISESSSAKALGGNLLRLLTTTYGEEAPKKLQGEFKYKDITSLTAGSWIVVDRHGDPCNYQDISYTTSVSEFPEDVTDSISLLDIPRPDQAIRYWTEEEILPLLKSFYGDKFADILAKANEIKAENDK